jgi:hypothetical protein
VETRTPGDLVGEKIAQAGHDRLVHESGFELATQTHEALLELAEGNVVRVRPELSEQRVNVAVVMGESDALELAHVAIAQLALGGYHHDSVMAMPRLTVSTSPDQTTGHPEMEDDARLVVTVPASRGAQRCHQPLAMPVRRVEQVTDQRSLEVLDAGLLKHARVKDLDVFDTDAHRVFVEHAAKAFDVG